MQHLQVWQVLTDYEALPEFVPNLGLCERLPLSRDMASRLVRLRQVWLQHVCAVLVHSWNGDAGLAHQQSCSECCCVLLQTSVASQGVAVG